jgi:hypothetical protein
MKTNLMKRYNVPRISVVVYLSEHLEIDNPVNLEERPHCTVPHCFEMIENFLI